MNFDARTFLFRLLKLSASFAQVLVITATVAFLASDSFAQDSSYEEEEYGDEMDMEMGMDEEYGDGGYGEGDYGGGDGGYGSPGFSRGRSGGSAQDVFAQQFTNMLSSAFQNGGFASITDPEAAPPIASGPVLLNEATVAYSKGNQKLALDLFFGHIVAEYENAQSPMRLAKYSRLMRRPAWTTRWGISIDVRGEATDPQPIGDVAARERPTGRQGFGQGGGMEGGYGDEGYGEESGMEENYGEGMEEDYGSEMEEGYGDMEMEMEESYGGGRSRRPAAAAPVTVTPGARLASLEMKMLDDEADKLLKDNLGVVATIIAEEFGNRYSNGSFGPALTDVSEESGSPDSVAGEFVDLLDSAAESMPMWRPGIVFVGQGTSASMVSNAKNEGLDILLHLQVFLKPLRGGFTQNTCRCRLIHVPTGNALVVSKPIDSLKFAQESRSKGLGSREYVEDQLEKFWEIVDQKTVVSALPSLTPEVAKSRVGSLLGSGGGKNLRTLAEVRLFQAQQLLSEDDVLTAFDIVGGEDAMELLFGSEEEKLKVVREWASGTTE